MLSRRNVLAAPLLTLAAGAAWGQTPGPRAWIVERGAGRAFILGYADAPDERWLTPMIRAAFEASTELWVETPPSPPPQGQSPVIQALGYGRGTTLFETLGPELSVRVRALAARLQVEEARLAPLRPWLAYYVLNGANRARQGRPQFGSSPEATLVGLARARGLPIHSEYPDYDTLLRFFAGMPDAAQRDYMRSLLDYIDMEEAGLPVANDGWIAGEPTDVNIDRMRLNTPALYELMHVRRNAWWARRIPDLVRQGRRPFVMLGLNHVLGPHSVPRQLRQRDAPIRRA